MYQLLIADDEPSMLDGLMAMMDWAALGCQVAGLYTDGRRVLEHLERAPADLLLMDICMPQVSGLEVAEYVYSRRMPVGLVFISGHREFEYARQAMRYGVRHYLTKPVLPSALCAALREVLPSPGGAAAAAQDILHNEMPFSGGGGQQLAYT